MNLFAECEGATCILATGADVVDLLQRIASNDCLPLASGIPVATLLTSEKGRVAAIIGVAPRDSANREFLIVGDRGTDALGWIKRFIIMEDVSLTDVSSEYRQYVAFAVDASSGRWHEPDPATSPLEGALVIPWRVHGNTWRRIVAPRVAGLGTNAGPVKAGYTFVRAEELERLRVLAGIPSVGAEILPMETHPLEARLRPLISFTKGCYVGQEVIARLDTYRKVQRALVRWGGSGSVPPRLPADVAGPDGQPMGTIVSAVKSGEDSWKGLGFARTGVGGGTSTSEGTFNGGRARVVEEWSDHGVYKD